MISLAGVYALRMLGLFLILPVFALYADELEGATPILTGLAIGIYGLTQALLQIPLGLLSDRIGRKPVIVGGLLVFALGSMVAAFADTIHGIILGRALQGSGAIAATVLALASDLTREEQRTKIMAVLGLTIGLSFALALILGPVLHAWLGLPGIFWLTGVFALIAIGVIRILVPTPVHVRLSRDTQVITSAIGSVLRRTELLRLDLGVLVLHAALTANFTVIPILLRDVGLDPARHWLLYLPILAGSFALMLPALILGERHRRMKQVLLGGILLLGLSQLSLGATLNDLVGLTLSMFGFFAGFNLLEASLPSLVSRLAPPDLKGTAFGVYSTSQFFGAFVGGALGGVLLGRFGPQSVFWGSGLLILIWFALGTTMRDIRYLSSYSLRVGRLNAERARGIVEQLMQVRGVAEAVVIPEDGVAYLKVDRQALDEVRLREFAVGGVS